MERTRETLMGDTLIKLREARGWSTRVFAHKLGADVSTVRCWETGRRLPSTRYLRRIQRVMPEAKESITTIPVKVTRRPPKRYYVPGLDEKLMLLLDISVISLRDICNRIGCSTSAWWSWCNGYTVPNGVYLRGIAVTFDVSVDWLLGLKEERR